MKDEKTTPLRQRMIEDMRIRGMAEKLRPRISGPSRILPFS